MDEWIGGREGGTKERKGGTVEGWMGERKRRKEEGSDRKGKEGGGRGKGRSRGEKGEQREQAGKEGHSATGSGSADKLARSSSKSEDSPQVTLI